MTLQYYKSSYKFLEFEMIDVSKIISGEAKPLAEIRYTSEFLGKRMVIVLFECGTVLPNIGGFLDIEKGVKLNSNEEKNRFIEDIVNNPMNDDWSIIQVSPDKQYSIRH